MEPTVTVLSLIGLVALVGAAVLLVRRLLSRRAVLGTPADQATYHALHTASLAAPSLRAGLRQGAEPAVRSLRTLLGTVAVAVTDRESALAWSGAGHDAHATLAHPHAEETLRTGATTVLGPDTVVCGDPDCPVRHAVVAPLTTDDDVVGALLSYSSTRPSTGLVRAVEEVARFVSGQLDLAELDRSRTELAEAEVRALRAQISPHFIYNSLGAIASYVRTDPEHARELLLDFADFTRYSFRRHGEFTTLAEELRSIERYLALEQARFGERLTVSLRIAPEVLPVVVPFLCLQPLVENAVRHGLAGRDGSGQVTIVAEDAGHECLVSIDDDGVGTDPEMVARMLAGEAVGDSVGLGNVDERLRSAYGPEHGLVVETAPGAGTRVSLRLPKYRPGVQVD